MYRRCSFVAILFAIVLLYSPSAKAQLPGMQSALIHHVCHMSQVCLMAMAEDAINQDQGIDSDVFRESGCEEFMEWLEASAKSASDEQLQAMTDQCQRIRESS